MRTLKHTIVVLLILAMCWVFIPFAIIFIAMASGGEPHKDNTHPTFWGYIGGILYIASGPLAARAYLKWAGKKAAQAQDLETQERIGVQRIQRNVKEVQRPGT